MLLTLTVMTTIGAALGLLLGIADKVFAVEGNPLADEIAAMMPGSQCGQCGFPGCKPAAQAIANGTASVSVCPPGGRALAEKLAARLGVALDAGAGASEPLVAFIDGAVCTGCTRCYKACPTDAIVGASNQIHVVMGKACTGCAKCQEACPEDCISLQAEPKTVYTWNWPKPQVA
ncbi:MAG: RnfABCDGE type electron transport complex subunit B [Spongiibacteraceae bacterium]